MIPKADVPAPIRELLEHLDCSEALETFIDPERILYRVDRLEFDAFLKKHGYRIERRDGNVYGSIRISPADTRPAPVLRIVTKSDVAAVYGSGRGRWAK